MDNDMTLPKATHGEAPTVLPYSHIVGQETLRLALEIAYVAPTVGGVLATGQRGTAKSTMVRAFSRMVTGRLPVTLPIGATDDRVLGGWRVDALMESRAVRMPGLIEEAGSGKTPGMLYIDEINLLDDHLVNIILDVASTGILSIQRDNINEDAIPVHFTLVGTMNPDEGSLRPQLLDRFGLVIPVESSEDPGARANILRTVMQFEEELRNGRNAFLTEGHAKDAARKAELEEAKLRLADLQVSESIMKLAADVAAAFSVEGHRGELVMTRAARAVAAIRSAEEVRPEHIAVVAPLALIHRRAVGETGTLPSWSSEDADLLRQHVTPTTSTVSD
jgi:magnesium chelatase subunit I